MADKKKRSPEMADLFDESNSIVEKVDATNEYGLTADKNLENHSMSRIGRGSYVTPLIRDVPIFRTKQSAYRFAGWLVEMAETLPDEDDRAHTWEQIRKAIHDA